jgi:hypothetical protein
MDAQSFCDVLDQDARRFANLDGLELELKALLVKLSWAAFCHRDTFSVRSVCPQNSGKIRVGLTNWLGRGEKAGVWMTCMPRNVVSY